MSVFISLKRIRSALVDCEKRSSCKSRTHYDSEATRITMNRDFKENEEIHV